MGDILETTSGELSTACPGTGVRLPTTPGGLPALSPGQTRQDGTSRRGVALCVRLIRERANRAPLMDNRRRSSISLRGSRKRNHRENRRRSGNRRDDSREDRKLRRHLGAAPRSPEPSGSESRPRCLLRHGLSAMASPPWPPDPVGWGLQSCREENRCRSGLDSLADEVEQGPRLTFPDTPKFSGRELPAECRPSARRVPGRVNNRAVGRTYRRNWLSAAVPGRACLAPAAVRLRRYAAGPAVADFLRCRSACHSDPPARWSPDRGRPVWQRLCVES